MAVLFLVFTQSPVLAESGAPPLFNYQGYLNDTGGNGVTGKKTMSFRIYASESDPVTSALWVSGNVTVRVVNGFFSVTLGEAPQNPLSEDIFSDATRYLGITVDGSELAQRKRLVSVPYALNSASSGIPGGGIIMWSGSVSNIPEGWALCDGTNGTPDLRNRFIVGAGSTYSPGNTGGVTTNNLSHTHTVSSHSHTVTAEAPATNDGGNHYHGVSIESQPVNMGTADPTKSVRDGSDKTCASQSHSHSVVGNTGWGGTHSHTVTSHSHGGNTGTAAPATSSQLSSTVENRPPYYALCFIMKL